MKIDGGKEDGNEAVDVKSRKAMQLIELLKHYTRLALMARDTSEFLGRHAEISWSNGDEDSVDWNERKGDRMYYLSELYLLDLQIAMFCSHCNTL